MPKNARLNGCLDEIELDVVEREAPPRLLMKLSIQFHLAGLSLSNTGSFLTVFSIDRARSTVHNWVHEADRQPEDGKSPEYVAVDETVIQLDDQQYWLYAAVDPDSNEEACNRHGLRFRYQRHGNRNSVERVFRKVKRRTRSFSTCFSNASAETANEWLLRFAFAWNQLI